MIDDTERQVRINLAYLSNQLFKHLRKYQHFKNYSIYLLMILHWRLWMVD